MQKRTIDLTITSLRKQNVTLVARYGIEDVTIPLGVLAAFKRGNSDCQLNLPENKPVEIHLKLGQRKPFDWIDQVV